MSTKRRVKKFRDTLKLDSIFRNRSTKGELVPWELARWYPAAFYFFSESPQIMDRNVSKIKFANDGIMRNCRISIPLRILLEKADVCRRVSDATM